MGSCYSRKASGGSYSYTTVSMASTKHEDASRLARPTPYTRNSNSSGLNFKKKIPLSTKQDVKNCQVSTIYAGSNKSSVNITTVSGQSSIPRLQSPLLSSSTLDTDETENKRSYTDPNSNSTENINVMNNNNILDDSDIKQDTDKSIAIQRQNKRATDVDSVQQIDNFKYDVNKSYIDMTKPNSDATKISVQSKIPSICTAQITGLPRPQVAQILNRYGGRSTENIAQFDNEKKSMLEEDNDKTSQKHSRYKWQTRHGSSDLSDGNRADGDSHDSCAVETWDSGLGSSINEKTKQEDAETLKDIEHFDSLESSPICQTKHLDINSDITKVTEAMSDFHVSSDRGGDQEIAGIKKYNISTPKYKDKSFGLNKSDTDGLFSQKFISGVRGNKLKNFSYDSQQTYAAYRNSLNYKRIPILKHVSQFSSGRSLEELRKDTPSSKDYSNIPRITRRSLNDGTHKKDNIRSTSISHIISKKSEMDRSKDLISPESDEKSDSTSQGIVSPVSELENREFLIDDEIADQPGLISFGNTKNNVPSLQQSVNELHVLQAANNVDYQGDLGSFSARLNREKSAMEGRERLTSYSDLGSSSSSLASDDLMMDYDKSIDTVLEECNSVQSDTLKKSSICNEKQQYRRSYPVAKEGRNTQSDSMKKSDPTYNEKQQYRNSYPMTKEGRKTHLYRKNSESSVGGSKSSVSRTEWRHRSASLPLRPPRQMAVTEIEDGSMRLDASSYRLLRQDLNGMKTMLLKLKRILHEAETLNPFDPNPKNMFYHSLAHIDLPLGYSPNSESIEEEHSPSEIAEVMQENTDLRRQLVLLQQQLEERDRTVRLLQQQMTKYTKVPGSNKDDATCNAATQTERSRLWTNNLSHTSSLDDTSNGTLVSSEMKDAFEKHFERMSKEQASLRNRMKQVTRSLSSINQTLQNTAQRRHAFPNRSVSSFDLHHSTSIT